MRWLELTSRVDGEAVEAVSEVFTPLVVGGVVIEPEMVPGADDGFTLGKHATVRGYVPLDAAAADKARRIEEALWHLRMIWPVGDLVSREVAEEDWANAWKAHYTTFRVGKRLVIRPTWLEYRPAPDDVVLSLDPGVAFGTGLHPTTRRCLELVEAQVRPGDSVFDVGTGSGILAIAAGHLGARSILAVDTDPLAVGAAESNIRANGLADRIQVAPGSADSALAEGPFDVILANIIARVILEIAPDLVARLRPGGTLITAGIIADRADELSDALSGLGLRLERYTDGDWVAFVGRSRRS